VPVLLLLVPACSSNLLLLLLAPCCSSNLCLLLPLLLLFVSSSEASGHTVNGSGLRSS
jgi:hypothetical protein